MDFLLDFFTGLVSNIKEIIIVIVLIVIAVFVIMYISKHNATNTNDYLYEVTADEILQEYMDNNIQAELKYEDNTIKISGSIYTISGSDDRIDIVLDDSFLGYRITMTFTDTKEIEQIASLVEGDNIVVVGKVAEYEDGILTNNLNITKCNYEE